MTATAKTHNAAAHTRPLAASTCCKTVVVHAPVGEHEVDGHGRQRQLGRVRTHEVDVLQVTVGHAVLHVHNKRQTPTSTHPYALAEHKSRDPAPTGGAAATKGETIPATRGCHTRQPDPNPSLNPSSNPSSSSYPSNRTRNPKPVHPAPQRRRQRSRQPEDALRSNFNQAMNWHHGPAHVCPARPSRSTPPPPVPAQSASR